MSVFGSIGVSMFMLLIVFSALFGLYLCIRGFSYLCNRAARQGQPTKEQ